MCRYVMGDQVGQYISAIGIVNEERTAPACPAAYLTVMGAHGMIREMILNSCVASGIDGHASRQSRGLDIGTKPGNSKFRARSTVWHRHVGKIGNMCHRPVSIPGARGAPYPVGDRLWRPRPLLALLGAFRRPWLCGQLGAVPHADYPDGGALHSIEEPIGPHNDLAVGEASELWNAAPGLGELLQSAETLEGPRVEPTGGGRPLRKNVGDDVEELSIARRREPYLHASTAFNIWSASAKTAASSRPRLFAISRSPAARMRRICRSRSPSS